jgi:hypothetical protein
MDVWHDGAKLRNCFLKRKHPLAAALARRLLGPRWITAGEPRRRVSVYIVKARCIPARCAS